MLIAILAELENGTFENGSVLDSMDLDQHKNKSTPKQSKTSFDNCVKSLFVPLKIVINKIPNQKEANLKWVLGILNCHLLKISISNSEEDNLNEENDSDQSDDKTAKLLKQKINSELNKKSLQRFDYLLPDYLNFLSEFVDQYTNNLKQNSSNDNLKSKITLIKALLSILYHPLMHLDLYDEKLKFDKLDYKLDENILELSKTKDNLLTELKGIKYLKKKFQIYSYQIVNLIRRLEPNIYELYELENLICKQEENSINLTEELVKFSFGVHAYICYCLLDERSIYLPSIYSSIFIFKQHIQYIIPLLERTELLICSKGLELVYKLIFKIHDLTLKSNFLDYLRENPLDKILIKIMRFSSSDEHRRKSLKIYKKLITILNDEGRYNFLFKTIAEPNQFNGVRGLMVSFYKDFLLEDNNNPEFIGCNLQNFIRLIMDQINLVQEEFDLIENMDLLMCYLNFIRFLLMWDKLNRTGILNDLKLIDEFSNKLKKKIEFGRNFLKMKINSTKSDTAIKKRKSNDMKLEINCLNGDDKINDLFHNFDTNDELNMYEQGLVNVDMIDSVLARVNELISNFKV